VLPTIAISSDKATLKAGETATITFTLSEVSADFTKADVTLVGGSLGPMVQSSTDPKVYTATFTPTAGSTAAQISVASAMFTDASGNQNADGAEANNILEIVTDTELPTIVVSSDKTALKGGETATITFTLSEISTNFALGDVVYSGGTLSNFSGSGKVYTATFTPTSGSTAAQISVASAMFTDASGNQNADGAEANNKVSMTVDTSLPTIAVSSNKTALKAGDTATITFTLSEPSTDFGVDDITYSGGTLSNFTGSGTSYTVTFSPTPGSTVPGVVSVASGRFADGVGNLNADGSETNNTVSMTTDTVPPSIAISSNKTALKAGETATISFTLSEPSTDFSDVDLTLTGGTISNFSGSGTTYTATFTPTPGYTGISEVSVLNNKFSDPNGNFNQDETDTNNKVSMSTDAKLPAIAITSDKATLKAGETATVTFTLSEASADFVNADIATTGGSLSPLVQSSTDPKVYTATFTPTSGSTGTGKISVDSGKFSDAAGNFNADGLEANNNLEIASDTALPSIAITSDKALLGANGTALITFTLTKPSTDFSLADISYTGGTISGFTGSGTSYTAVFTPATGATQGTVIKRE
jgi:hypothetical protein